jgi:hypothetical protein
MWYARDCIVSLASTCTCGFANSLEVEEFRNLIYRDWPRLWTQSGSNLLKLIYAELRKKCTAPKITALLLFSPSYVILPLRQHRSLAS